ncbi:MAG: HDOD domain-containing protein [Kiritimatiellae bacterium]|nr:HDOD domain-containing protein [Kiritimatiellia bacterium]
MSSWHDKLVKVMNGLEYQDLSTIPAILGKIMETSRDPNAGAHDLARICAMDKSSSARIIRAANSAFYSTRETTKVSTIRDAIVRIGFDASREIVTSAVVCGLFKSNKVLNDYSSAELWKHSMAVGVANRLIYSVYFKRTRIEPYLAGLLHDFGISIEHQFLYHDGFEDSVLERERNASLLVDEERAHMGITHEELGKAVASEWNFPDHIIEVIGHHHTGSANTSEAECLVHATRVAELMCHALGYGYSDFPESHLDQLYGSVTKLGLDDSAVVLLAEQLKKEIDSLTHLGWFSSLKVRRIA